MPPSPQPSSPAHSELPVPLQKFGENAHANHEQWIYLIQINSQKPKNQLPQEPQAFRNWDQDFAEMLQLVEQA